MEEVPKPAPVIVSLAPPAEPVEGLMLTNLGVSEMLEMLDAPFGVPS